MSKALRRGLRAGAIGVVAFVAACAPPPTRGVYLHRERYGAIVLDLDDGGAGRVAGDLALTRLGVDGGMRVVSRRLSGSRSGDTVDLGDTHGIRVTARLSADGARVTMPDGGIVTLARADADRRAAMLAGLARQAQALRRRDAGSTAP